MKLFTTLTKTYSPKHRHKHKHKHFSLPKQHLTTTVTKSTQITHYQTDQNLVHKIHQCTNLGHYNHGQTLHCHVLKTGSLTNVFISSALINFYVKFGLVENGHLLFDEMCDRKILVSWNSLISGYVRNGKFRKGLSFFFELEKSSFCADEYSFTAVLSVCGQLRLVELGKCVHSRVVKFGVECSGYVCNCLIDMYGKCELVDDAVQVFDEMWFKDVFSWNSVIAACTRNRKIEQAFAFLNQMPNPDTVSYNEMISGVAQFGDMEQAIEILSTMVNPNSSSWNSILTGYVNRNRSRDAIEFFYKMHLNDILMDEFTFSSILSGIARVGALTWGTLIHCCVVKYGFDESVVIGSALIDMYSKCGQLNTAEFLFESLPGKNLVTWNAMISGFAHNENSTKVIEIFERLKHTKDLQPDGITFLNVLSACWHNKTPLEVATQYFDSMIHEYKIHPTVEHCSCIIRLMGHEGEVGRAVGMINRLGFESNAGVWRALLAACGVCGDLEVAETAASKVIDLEGDGEFVYVMMSNIYARLSKWEDASAMRKKMRDSKVIKEAGFSWIE